MQKHKDPPSFDHEKELFKEGFKFICGIDEAGRGALAGPLVCAAVILKEESDLLFDSKTIDKTKRETAYEYIVKNAVSFSVGVSDVNEISKFGIQTATYIAGHKAILNLKFKPDFLIIDHYRFPATQIPQLPLTHGDSLSQSVAAASIIAKVTRDKIMTTLSQKTKYKKYHFASHFGYGTKQHYSIIESEGLCDLHRKNFKIIDNQGQTFFNFNKSK